MTYVDGTEPPEPKVGRGQHGGRVPNRSVTWASVALLVAVLAAIVTVRPWVPGPAEIAASGSPSTETAPAPSVHPSATPPVAAIPPGRDDIPFQPGTATEVIVIVDASETDDQTAAGIRAGLMDFVQQLPEYDFLTLIAAGDSVRRVVHHLPLDRAGRTEAIESIQRLAFGGPRQLVRGVDAALAAANDIEPGNYDALLIATGDDGSTEPELDKAGQLSDDDGHGITWLDLHGVAVGTGPHEAVLARLDGSYQWASDGGDVVRALTPYRLIVSESTLRALGSLPPDDGPIEVVAGASGFALRFSVYSEARHLALDITAPSGRRYDADSLGEDISVQELGERVTVVVNGAEEGTWEVGFSGADSDHGDAWFEIEETLSQLNPLTTAYGTGDTTADLRTGIALMGRHGSALSASARILAADGSERTVELAPMENDELNIGAELTLGAIIDDPQPAGSYSILLELELTEPDGVDRRFAWLVGAYVAPEQDTDGDGLRDALELKMGLDPEDSADGAADHDYDGLSTADELTIYETSPGDWDTDYGGESDGSEVDAGRDPLDETDDVREVTCLELVPTPNPDATPSPTPQVTPEPAPELEALLPDEVLGRSTEKVSMKAPDELGFIFGLFDAFLACTDTERSDLSLAVAVAPDLQNWGVIAVEIDGVAGQQMQDIWLFRLGPGGPAGRLTEHDVDGRHYVSVDNGWATYATDETFYWITNLTFGDSFPDPNDPTPEPIPDGEMIIEAFIRQLPVD